MGGITARGVPPHVNVRDFGARGNGSTDDTAAIQAALNSGAKVVIFPKPATSYKTTSTLTPAVGQTLTVENALQYPYSGTPTKIQGAFDGPIITVNVTGVGIYGLTLQGSNNAAHTNNVGILGSASFCTVARCAILFCGGPAIKWTAGFSGRIADCFTSNCVLSYASLADYVGAVDIAGTDFYIHHNEFGAVGDVWGNGYSAALVIRNGGSLISDNICEKSEAGLVVTSASEGCSFVGNRADLNGGHGFVVAGNTHTFVANKSHRNSRHANNTYDGFSITATRCTFTANSLFQTTADQTGSGGPGVMRYGFNDQSAPSAGQGNLYIGNTNRGLLGTGVYNIASSTNRVLDLQAAAKQTYAVTNLTTDRAFDADTVTVAELADVVGTLVADLRAAGLVG